MKSGYKGFSSVRRAPYLFIAPFFIVYFAFNVFPLLFSFVISLTKWTGVGDMTILGFGNYKRLFTDDPLFWQSMWNTVRIIIIVTPVQILAGLLMAVLLKDFFRGRVRSALQFVNFSPFITTPVAVGILFSILFDARKGTINQILMMLGLIEKEIDFLTKPFFAIMVLCILLHWKYFGYLMVMFMAGLSTIPETEYEAAKIDGASWLQSFLYITIPRLKNTFTFILTTGLIGSFQLFAEPVLLFQQNKQPYGGPGKVAHTLVMYLYDTAFRRFDLGYGAAMSFGIFLVVLVLSVSSVNNLLGGEKE